MRQSKYAAAKVTLLQDSNPQAFKMLRKRLTERKSLILVGFPEHGPVSKEGLSVATIATVHEYGSPKLGIAERSFLRSALYGNRAKYVALALRYVRSLLQGKSTLKQALEKLGNVARGDVQEKILQGPFVPLQPATVRRKGSSQPLLDTGQLRQSVTWVWAEDPKDTAC